MLGDHSYTGKLGDVEINPANAMNYNDGIYSTTLGAGAYNSGSLAAVTGALSIASGKDTKNTGATIYGSLNSIESATSNSIYSGVASSVLGFANRTQNANAALIWGTGNEVTNSIEDIGIDTDWNNVSVAEAQQKAIKAMQSSKYAGGSVLAIGGGNKADYAKYSQLTGVQNKVTGTKTKAAEHDFVNGYQNTVTKASDVTVIGTKNEVTADGNKVIGDNHKVSGKNNVIFGSADKLIETTVNNAVVLGHNAKVTGEGGVALGVGSVADRANAVSVGSTGANRQIINVAAGEADTDAVNVSQLKKATANANKGWKLSTEGGTANQVASEATVNFSGKKDAGGHQNITVSNEGNNVKIELASELKNVTGVVNGNSRVTLGTGIAGITNGQESVIMMNGSTTINGVVGIDNTGKISGVANGEADKDAVNYGQLKDVKAEALKHSTVTNGDNIAVTETTNKDGGKEYKVALNNDIHLFGDNGAMVSISGSHGTIWTSGSVTAGSVVAGDVVMDSTTATVSGLGNKTTAYAGFATTGKAATEEQLKEVATEAGKHTTLVAGDNVTLDKKETDKGLEYTVNAVDTKYTAGNGITIDAAANNAISVNLKEGEVNLAVDEKGLSLNKDLQGIESISNNTSKLVLREGWAGMQNGVGASVFMVGGLTTINDKVTVDEQGKISGVAAGVNNDDAVNVSQLKKVEEAAGNANKGWNLSTNGVATAATNVKPGDNVDFSGDKNVSVSNDGTAVSVKLKKNLKDIETISNGGATLTLGAMGGMVAELANGQGASVKLFGDTTTINGKVNVYKDGRIAGVADGVNATDAVNVSQLQKAAAASAATVTDGVNTTVTTTTAEDGHVDYKVNLNKNLTGVESISNGGASLTLGAMGGMVSEFANGQGASVKLFGDTTTINGKVNVYKDGRIAGVADGVNANDAVNVSQLQKAAAASATTVSDGVNTTVTATKAEDGHTDYKVNLNKDLVGIESISNAGASLTMNGIATELANGQGASVKLFGDTTTINNAVTVYKDGRISGVADGINNNDAVNVGQLNKVSEIANKGWNLATNGVATEATNVKPGETVDFSGDKNISVSHDGTKVKVELNKDLDVNSVQTNALNSKYNLSVGTMAENGIMPFFVNSTGAFYAASNKFSVDKDGNMNANSVQTNALNSKYNLSVGTANENGIVPFFVNSNGAFYAANNNFSVDKDGKVIATAGEIGNVVLNNGVYTGHSALRDGELFVGDASGNYSQITTKGAKLGKVTVAEDGKISGVAAGEVSSTSTDAINGSQLHQTNENVAALDKRVTQNEADIATNKANIAQNAADIAQNKADIAANRADIDKNKADIAQNKADIAQNKADIAQNKADIAQNKTDIKNLDNRVTNVEELAKKHTTVTAGDNITVAETTNKDGGKEYKVALDKDITLDSVTTGQTVMNNDGLKVGDKVSVTKDAVTAGKTSISDEGVKVGDKTYISDKGLNANGQQITNVADGKENGDAVNYGQLKGVENQVVSNTNRINQLGSRVNKVGAGAAALAALHPMDFDPDDKLTFSAGYGNYGGENAAAIGAYYRPDEKVMFSVGGTVGNGENMVNAGVSFSLDRTNHVSNSRTAMAREILDLRAEVTELKAMVAKGGLGSIAEDKMKIFPDVAENHWAYEYVGKLAAAGIIEGYPDGNFSGDRMMSRYEFAAMLYRAMQKGAQLDSKIINEFAPEMGRIRVDRISGEDGDRDKIERVRVNAVKGERDHYGNKIAKAEAKAK